jgi:hypothetical protein
MSRDFAFDLKKLSQAFALFQRLQHLDVLLIHWCGMVEYQVLKTQAWDDNP